MVPVFYSADYVASRYAFDTTRKARAIAQSLAERPLAAVELAEPAPLSREIVAAVHDPQYVAAVQTGQPRSLAESQGFRWDEGLWPMVLASNGGALAAARAALAGGGGRVAFQRPAPREVPPWRGVLYLQRPGDRRAGGPGGGR